jgi:hypothetical protein
MLLGKEIRQKAKVQLLSFEEGMECHSNSTLPTIPTVTKSPRNLIESPAPETMVEAPSHSKKNKQEKADQHSNTEIDDPSRSLFGRG